MSLLRVFLKPVELVSNIRYLISIQGQSNPAGIENAQGQLPLSWQSPQSNILIANYGNYPGPYGDFDFVPLWPGHTAWSIWGNTPSGAEQTLMHRLQEHYGGTVYLSKLAFGGYGIDHWLPGGDFYDANTQLVEDQEAYFSDRNYELRLLPMIWWQGETDALNNTSTSVYLSKLLDVIDRDRSLSALNEERTWYFVKISALQTAISDTQRNEINAAINQMPSLRSNCFVFDTSVANPSILPDNIHYDMDSLQAIGQALFDTIISSTDNYLITSTNESITTTNGENILYNA